ncbi:MAG: phosphotransferase family protein [Ktedonobacteraceae bacterium]
MNYHPVDMRLIEILVSRVFPPAPTSVERVMEGVSTYVYRITYQHETFYLRLLPEEGASFAPEVAVHNRLRQMQVKVPDVIYFEDQHEALHRSVMVTTEIKGRPVSQRLSLAKDGLNALLIEAGRDLARINSVVVDGFGWMKRNDPDMEQLHAQWPTYRAFALEHWQADLAYLATTTLQPSEFAMLESIPSSHTSWFEVEQGQLAHGDFDTTHVYQEHGRYTGIIDFGELRGANQYYDLGHFHMSDGEMLPHRILPGLLRGYREAASLPSDYEQHIYFTSVLINVRALARSLQKRPPTHYTQHLLQRLREDLTALRPFL